MKNKIKLCFAIAMLLPSAYALASGTCAAPVNLNTSGASFSIPANSCNGTAQATSLCGAFDYSQKKEDIYSFTLSAGFTATTLTMNTVQGGFTPAMFITSSACAAADTCDANGTNSVSLAGLTVGTPYFLIISTTPAGAASNCGTYNLASDGTLPVKLQKFSVN